MANPSMMYAFDHVPALVNATFGNMALYATDYPFTLVKASTGNGTAGTASDANGMWMQNAAVGYSGGQFNNGFTDLGAITIAVSKAWDSTKNRSYLGFRFKVTQSTVNASVMSAIIGYLQGSTQYTLLGWADFAWTLGQAYYVEVMLDRVANTRTVWVDGSLVVNAAQLTLTTYSGSDTLQFGVPQSYVIGGAANYPYQYWYKDIYLKDENTGVGATGRLGSLTAKPITLASASGSSWVPSTGTILSALNTAINTSTPSTPNVAMPSDGTALSATFQSTVDPSAWVMGVLMLAGGSKTSGTTTALRMTLTDPANNSQALTPTVFPSGSFAYGKNLGFLPTALDGSPWSAAKIASLSSSTLAATS